MVPGPVATLEAPLGHITEHLLQLLGGGGGRKCGGSYKRNSFCMVGRKIEAVERGRAHMCVCVRGGHKGRGCVVRCRPPD